MIAVRNIALGGATLLYPFVVFLSLGHLEPRWVALLLLALAALRLRAARHAIWRAAAGVAVVLALCTMAANAALPLKLYPVLVNAVLLAAFGFSLWRPPSVVERLARMTQPELPPEGVAYTRQVTRVWCAFFVVNGALAAGTALWASDAVWAFYNGLLAYGLMGTLFAGEWLVRQRVMKRHGDA
jgi:uncharacterized membrane protein